MKAYEKMEKEISNTYKGLKDFQKATVDYVYDQLYNNGHNRMLIADEVGLGKTIVAKGLIAKAYENWRPTNENPVFNVVYICSNLALVTQNLKKLNFTGNNRYVEDNIERLSYLALKPKKEDGPFRIDSLTPGTSFHEKSHQGTAKERAIIYTLLTHFDVFDRRKSQLTWIMKGNNSMETANWRDEINKWSKERKSEIRESLFSKFRTKLLYDLIISKEKTPKIFQILGGPENMSMWEALKNLCEIITGHNQHQFNFQAEVIRILRRTLSELCLEYLGADIFILDEFQRYNNLIKIEEEAENPALELARKVFNIPGAKVIMLSATPFKPYTNDFDELNGEVHYHEFKSVLKFLIPNKSEDFWIQFEQDRRQFFNILKNADQIKEHIGLAKETKSRLENIYKETMVRSERLMVAKDSNALIKKMLENPITLEEDDIRDFVALDRLVNELNKVLEYNIPAPIEYVKSTPYALSFLDNYQLKEKLRQQKDNPVFRKLLKETSNAWIDLDRINSYKPLITSRGKQVPNAKLRLLIEKTLIEAEGWKLLWVPPSLTYYPSKGAYKNSINFSKTLIFSSWLMVPRMVSSLVSFEAERLSVGKYLMSENKEKNESTNYFPDSDSKRRSPYPIFTFKVDSDQEPRQMTSFVLIYPCLTLASLYHPKQNLIEKKSLLQLRKDLKIQIKQLFKEYGLTRIGSRYGGDFQKWFWAAPILLDKFSKNSHQIRKWFESGFPSSELTVDSDDDKGMVKEKSGKNMHFNYAKKYFDASDWSELSLLNENQIDELSNYLADLTIAGPSISALRALNNNFNYKIISLSAAFNIASAFLTMFNKPESIAIIRLEQAGRENVYWKQVLEYCLDGNIQAMLDEFIYLLKDCENYNTAEGVSDQITDILGVKTSGIVVDDIKTFIKEREQKPIRTHYAVDFGTQKILTATGANRQINLRQTFNSPFRPFVLATTSIGQEGLDFHLYCKRIFHWNLPSNPIDFDQREGRINRYKGLVIRQNITAKYKDRISNEIENSSIWDSLFKVASKNELNKDNCELVPFWHTETEHDIKIERFVPLYQFSRDIGKYNNLIKVLTFYRLTFGQPRQEELIEAIENKKLGEEELALIKELIINLSPINF
ncbi:MAG: DEAD/DEAH box helicase [Bacteroidales bacterium]